MENVQLKDFIETTLVNVAQGIRHANEKLVKEKYASESPFTLRPNRGDDAKIPGVQFDVVVTATKGSKDQAGFVVALVNLGGGAKTERSIGNEMMHRIKFEVGLSQYFS